MARLRAGMALVSTALVVTACSFVPEVGPLRASDDAGADASSSDEPVDAGGSSTGSTDAAGLPDGTTGTDDGGGEPGPRTWTVVAGPKDEEVFTPKTITIRAGDEVRWFFEVSGHNVIGADGQFCAPNDTSCGAAPELPRGSIYTRRFLVPGTFDYYCGPHVEENMRGTVIVQ